MTPQQIAELPLPALLIAIGMAVGALFLTGRFTLGRETDRAIERAEKAEKGEAELKGLVISLTATVSTQAEQLARLTTVAEKLTGMLGPRPATS